jgi:hypothetical protein
LPPVTSPMKPSNPPCAQRACSAWVGVARTYSYIDT